MLDLSHMRKSNGILVIGATNRPDVVDIALRRSGRLDSDVCLGIPNVEQRKQILLVATKNLSFENIDFDELAAETPGYVGADLLALVREATAAAVHRLIYYFLALF